MEKDEIKNKVKEGYGRVALENRSCCGAPSSCCGSSASIQSIGEMIGYSKEEMNQVPEGANLGLGCGNPVALASLREGQTVLDLGSGAGFDCFLAAKAVGDFRRTLWQICHGNGGGRDDGVSRRWRRCRANLQGLVFRVPGGF